MIISSRSLKQIKHECRKDIGKQIRYEIGDYPIIAENVSIKDNKIYLQRGIKLQIFEK